MALVNMRQGESESLRSFMACFSHIFVKIRNLNLEVALHSIIMALKLGSLSNNPCKLPPRDMDDLRTRASNYIQMEEMTEFHDSVRTGQSAPCNHKDHRHPSQTNGKKGKSEGLTQELEYQVFTLFNTSRATLFEGACNVDLITLPPQCLLAHGVDKTKYCYYHRNYNQTTEGCITLRDKIEELVQSSTSSSKVSMQTHGQLSPTTFTDQDFIESDLEQNDPMVITVEIANFFMKKVLIDQGSSTNSLYMSTFQRLQIQETKIWSYHEQLVALSGVRVETRRYINLLTTFSNPSALNTISVRHLIVVVDTSYNSTLSTLGAIVSIPHLVMNFPSTNGQVVIIKVDQKIVRQCYIDNLKIQTKTSKEGNISTHVEILTDVKLDPRPLVDQGNARTTSSTAGVHPLEPRRPVCVETVQHVGDRSKCHLPPSGTMRKRQVGSTTEENDEK
ncbi:hypothetical protein CR513_36663, partial [Mucuna pruriens]